MSERIFQMIGAKDEADAVRILTAQDGFLANVFALTKTDNLEGAIGALRATDAFVAAVNTRTGKTGEGSLGVLQAWSDSHTELPKTREQLTAAKAKVENFAIEKLITDARNEGKLDKAQEDKIRARITAGTMNSESLAASLEIMAPNPALVNARELREPPREAPAAGSGGMPTLAQSVAGKPYEEFSPDQWANIRDQDGGEAIYQAARQDWINRGKPSRKPAAA